MSSSQERALIFDIQGFSVHDGPGGRTLVFFKGCPLRCYWCCNPEGQNQYREVMYRRSKCQMCYRCMDSCPNGAIHVKNKGDFIAIDRSKCGYCNNLDCVKGCYNGALKVVGKYMTIDELMMKIERDRRFWGTGGGVTLGGGEVMLQYKFAARLLEECHASYIHTAIETSGYAPWSHYQEVLKNVDWLFVDIKHMDPDIHRKGTGVSNVSNLENIERMASHQKDYQMVIRIPVIPGYNDNTENIVATAKFMKRIGVHVINILPFHRLATSKYEQLDRKYACKNMESPRLGDMYQIQNIFHNYGLMCYVGSDTPF
ncbi:MAG: glycyl-radical enzyme activating protein [Clostridia bacterium]|nr:MAG: glycyl-radical enzyme activating protein [Clostridia bacterium]